MGAAGAAAAARLRGLTPVTVEQGLAHLEGGRGHRIALTFDDGYRDNVTRALPLLAETGARATFYLTAGLIEERRAPWWDVLVHALEHARAAHLPAGWAPALPLASHADRARALATLAPGLRWPPAERERRLSALRDRLGVTDDVPCELARWRRRAR